MDEKIEKALEISKFLLTLSNQKRLLQEQFKIDVLFYLNGGQFTVDKVLISFVKTLVDTNQTDAILIDDHSTPIFIEDLPAFFDSILDVYFSAANKFLTEFNSLKTKRSVEGLIDV